MSEPEFPEEHLAYDSAGNCLGAIERPRKPVTWPNEADARYKAYAEQAARRKVAVAAEAKREEFGPGYAYQTLGDFIGAEDHQKMWIIKGAVAWGETSAWIGPPGSLKSALMSDLAISAAFGRDWHGRKSKGRVGVIYFALERADLVRRRIEAQIARTGISIDPERPGVISIVSSTIDLFTPESVAKVVRTVKNAEEFTGEVIGVIIFDTFAKLMAASGGDEDKAKDQGKVFANIERIKEKLGRPHVALVGHTGKDESRGARGSNAILGDADVMVTIAGEDIKTATVVKANDMAEGPLFSFKSDVHQFGLDEDGDPITVNIVSGDEVDPETPARRVNRWGKGLRLVRDAINAAVLEAGRDHRIGGGDGPAVKATTVQAARALHNQRYVSTGDGDRNEAERKAWARNFKQARDLNLVGGELANGHELIWLAA
ncbi:AAA family ATPase [Bradyrhizobium sp. 27S5]|uniref:AAA family ATPase n=1 Tax=Bradyrhizobium sp. 27S5 TaxID=3139728 RepID=UPI0030D194DF